MATRISILSAAALLIALTGTARASVPDAPELGPMGGVAGEVLRISATAVDSEQPAFVSLVFVDLLGRPVGPAAKLLVLQPGEAGGLELNFNLFGKRRAYVRPVVKFLEGSGPALIVAELYDQMLGRTVTRSIVSSDPIDLAGFLRFGPIAVAYGQRMRISLGAADAATLGCVASLEVRTMAGGVIDPNDRVSLAAGEWKFFEIDGSKMVARGEHAEFLPAVQMDPGANECVATVQVYDQSSGWTMVYVPGLRF